MNCIKMVGQSYSLEKRGSISPERIDSEDKENQSPKKSSETPIEIDEDLLLSALKGLELILRDSKDSAIELLSKKKEQTDTNNSDSNPSKQSNLNKLLLNFEIILKQKVISKTGNVRKTKFKYNYALRQQVCILLGSLSILFDSTLINTEICDKILDLLKISIKDPKRLVRSEAGKANCEWQLCLAGN